MSNKSVALLGCPALMLNKSLGSRGNSGRGLWRHGHSRGIWELVAGIAVVLRGRPRDYGVGHSLHCYKIYSFISFPPPKPTEVAEMERRGINLEGQIEQERREDNRR